MVKLAQRIGRIKPSPTIAITVKAKAMQADGIDVIGFGAGEPDFDTPEHIKKAAVDALKAGKTKYTPIGGINELKDAIIAKLKRDNGLTYSRDEILVSSGGKHSLYNIAQVLFEAGDEVIIPAPYWVSYPDQVLLNDAKPVILQTREEDGFKVKPRDLEQAITPRTKAFILNSPSNPTGAAYTREDLQALSEVLLRHNLICISDEIYEKIVYDGFEFASIASLGEKMKALTLIVNGASKVFSMTGWRMGFTAGPKEIVRAMTDLQGQVTTNINSITQWAAAEAYNGPQDFLRDWLKEFKRRRDTMVERLNKIPGVRCFKPQGAFYAFPNIAAYLGKSAGGKKISTDQELCDWLLDRHRVACVLGSGFGAPGFMRLSYATSMENIEKGLDRIEKGLKELS
jgi:aspartate aminotransferase